MQPERSTLGDYLVEHALPAELAGLLTLRAREGWTVVSVESIVTEWRCSTNSHGYERREAMKIMQTAVLQRTREQPVADIPEGVAVIPEGLARRYREYRSAAARDQNTES